MKPIIWIASSLKDLKKLPDEVQDVFGYALHLSQIGQKHPDAKSLRGFGDASVIEVIEDFRGDTFRAVYTVRYAGRIYVLHCFQKKSKHGIETPQHDIDLIRERLKIVNLREKEEHHE